MKTKQKIVKIALKLFLKKGFYNTSMQNIATDVGISKPAIYHHFKNKDEMIIGVLDYFTKKMANWNNDYFSNKTNYKEKMEYFFKALPIFKNVENLLLGKEDKDLRHSYNEFLLAISKYNDTFKERISKDILGGIERRSKLNKEAQKKGIIKKNIDCYTLSLMTNAIIEGLSFIYEVIPEDNMEEKLDDIFKLYWNLISK